MLSLKAETTEEREAWIQSLIHETQATMTNMTMMGGDTGTQNMDEHNPDAEYKLQALQQFQDF